VLHIASHSVIAEACFLRCKVFKSYTCTSTPPYAWWHALGQFTCTLYKHCLEGLNIFFHRVKLNVVCVCVCVYHFHACMGEGLVKVVVVVKISFFFFG